MPCCETCASRNRNVAGSGRSARKTVRTGPLCGDARVREQPGRRDLLWQRLVPLVDVLLAVVGDVGEWSVWVEQRGHVRVGVIAFTGCSFRAPDPVAGVPDAPQRLDALHFLVVPPANSS